MPLLPKCQNQHVQDLKIRQDHQVPSQGLARYSTFHRSSPAPHGCLNNQLLQAAIPLRWSISSHATFLKRMAFSPHCSCGHSEYCKLSICSMCCRALWQSIMCHHHVLAALPAAPPLQHLAHLPRLQRPLRRHPPLQAIPTPQAALAMQLAPMEQQKALL